MYQENIRIKLDYTVFGAVFEEVPRFHQKNSYEQKNIAGG
jgi:hypothetical protein